MLVSASYKRGKKTPKRRVVVKGTIAKKSKNSNTYKINYMEPFTRALRCDWFSVKSIVDL